MPLDTLLGSGGAGGESVSQNSGMGLNLGGQCFQSFLPSSQSERSVPVLEAAEGRKKQSFPSCTDLPDQVNILLQPKSSSNCKYYKVVDFVHSVIQHEKEKVLVENGAAKLSVNYGYVKPKIEQISLQKYVIASIRILNCLIQDGQISEYSNLKDYLGYLIKSMELAMRYEWRSVLEYDDHFHQLQATE